MCLQWCQKFDDLRSVLVSVLIQNERGWVTLLNRTLTHHGEVGSQRVGMLSESQVETEKQHDTLIPASLDEDEKTETEDQPRRLLRNAINFIVPLVLPGTPAESSLRATLTQIRYLSKHDDETWSLLEMILDIYAHYVSIACVIGSSSGMAFERWDC